MINIMINEDMKNLIHLYHQFIRRTQKRITLKIIIFDENFEQFVLSFRRRLVRQHYHKLSGMLFLALGIFCRRTLRRGTVCRKKQKKNLT